MRTASSVRPRWRSALLVVHLIATLALLGADLALFALGLAGLRGADPVAIYPAARIVAAWLVAPLAVASLATGLALALTSSWGLVTYWWVTIKLITTLVLVALLLLVLVPGLATAALAPAEVSDLQRVRFVIAPTVASLVLIANSLLGRYKPRWRLRTTHPQLVKE